MNQVPAPSEFLHSWYLLLVSLLSLLFLLLSSCLWANVLLVAVVLFLCFKNGLSAKTFARMVFYALVFSLIMYGLNLLWAKSSGSSERQSALILSARLFLLVLCSMSTARVINYTKVILYLIIHLGLKVIWGYPVMIALNSILLFKEEYEKIKLNGRLRNLSFMQKLGLLFPLLVFAIRHSQRGSLSLVTRGLNPSKSFYFSYATSSKDRSVFLLFLGFFAILSITCLAIRFYFR